MNTIQQFVQQLDQAHNGGAWHGPSTKEALEGVDAAAANRRPIAGAHNIFEIVHHLRVVDNLVRSHFRGEVPSEESDWPEAGAEACEESWPQALAGLEASQKALRETVAALPDAALGQNVPEKDLTYAAELVGILNHDLYHTGQIVLLRKAG
jgi:uncharacterized damage-inducible protein DinB